MPNTIKMRRNAVPGTQPQALSAGEVAVNTADGSAYIQTDDLQIRRLQFGGDDATRRFLELIFLDIQKIKQALEIE